MKVIILMICLLFSLSSKTNDFISTALCLIRNKTVKEEALNILNKILNKDYENIFQNLATAYIKVKDALLNQCLNKDDDNPAVLRSLSSSSECDYEKIDPCTEDCLKKKFTNGNIPSQFVYLLEGEKGRCIGDCYLKYCKGKEE